MFMNMRSKMLRNLLFCKLMNLPLSENDKKYFLRNLLVNIFLLRLFLEVKNFCIT